MVVIAIPMVALTGVSTAAFVLQLEQDNERIAAIAAGNLTSSAQAVLIDLIDAETGMRGYAVTDGDQLFLNPYRQGMERLNRDFAALRRSATSESEMAEVAAIEVTLKSRLTQYEALKSAVDSGRSGARLAVQLSNGKQIMDQLRRQLSTLVAHPAVVLVQKREQIAKLASAIKIVEGAGLVLGLLAGGVGIALFSSGISRRVELAASNATRLGTGTGLRETARAADELGTLNAALSNTEGLLALRLRELANARDQALLATEAKNVFLSRTSHELRTPLNAILGFAQLLEMSQLSADDLESAQHINRAGRHLLALINELIDISRVESGDLQISVEPVSIHLVTQECLALIKPMAAKREIDIDNQVNNPELAVAADHQRLKQVLVNVMSNAVKYNRHGGRISIGYVIGADNEIDLTVSDTGPGLRPEEIERIWVPFERLDADAHGIEGTGIGLPLARSMTEAMNGILTATSTPGVGSTFSVRLPRAADLEPLAPAPRVPDSPSAFPGPVISRAVTVLSIEDNMANSQVLERMFQEWPGVTLKSADNGRDGVAWALANEPDLILLDLHLPDISGEQIFDQLRSEPTTTGIPIVVLSADATPGTIRRLIARGAAHYLTKPLDLRELKQVLQTVFHPGATVNLNGTRSELSVDREAGRPL